MQTLTSSAGPLSLLTAAPAPGPASIGPAADATDSALPPPAFSSVLSALLPAQPPATVAAVTPLVLPLPGNTLPLQRPLAALNSMTADDNLPLLTDTGALPELTHNMLLRQIEFGPVRLMPVPDQELPLASDDEPWLVSADLLPAWVPAELPGKAEPAGSASIPAPALMTDADDAEIVTSEWRRPAATAALIGEDAARTPGTESLSQAPIGSEEPAVLKPLDSLNPATPISPDKGGMTPAVAPPVAAQTLAAAAEPGQKPVINDLPESLRQAVRGEKLEFGVDRQQWGGALGARIVTMVASDIQQARIQLDPPELGSLEIRLQVQQDQATVQVQTQNGQVRDVLEASAQRLRDALAAQGIQLAGFDVSERGQQQARDGQGGSGQQEAGAEDGEWLAAADDETAAPKVSLNLLDTFA